MTMATVNLLLGIISILFALAVALSALAYAVEGIRGQGLPRRWNLLIALVLGGVAWTWPSGIGQDFARASDALLLSQPADAGGLMAVVFWALISVLILMADVNYWRGLRRSLAAGA
ncbi:MAG: hypothetical protein ACM3N4_10970 [Nitrososphaerota archaeon]